MHEALLSVGAAKHRGGKGTGRKYMWVGGVMTVYCQSLVRGAAVAFQWAGKSHPVSIIGTSPAISNEDK